MSHINVEIKARCQDPDRVRAILKKKNADFKGVDRQTDTYFRIPEGRLKLRRGNIENSLIFYNRPDQPGPKQARVSLATVPQDSPVEQVLTRALGVLVTVEKEREIYFIENVKFHIDNVRSLGSFVEIEAIDADQTIPKADLLNQCTQYMKLLAIKKQDLINCSYSDMLLASRADAPDKQ